MSENGRSNYRWYLLALIAVTGTLVSAIPFSCLPVLFQEIADDMGLSLVQVGSIWGTVSLAGVFVSLISGMLGDRFGVKLVVSLACLLSGLTGAARGLSPNFLFLTVTVFIHGIVRSVIPINITKTIGTWFKGKNLGMAQGVGAMGMGLGLMLGPMISSTVLSPLLGGWRNVLYLYGGICVLMAIPWLATGREAPEPGSAAGRPAVVSFRQAFSRVVRSKALWLLGLTLMLRMGGIQGMTGYLSLYLRDKGWSNAAADGALSIFYAVSTISVIPVASFSDRIGLRKAILLPAVIISLVCFALLPVVNSTLVWIFMIVSGVFMDSFMAIATTMLLETEHVTPDISGIALGLVFTISQIGGVLAPPLGNSLASINPGLPFVFWAGLSLVSIFTLAFVKETGWKKNKA
jgi:MFS family permease